MLSFELNTTSAEPTLLEQYRSVHVPLVLEYQQTFTVLAVIAVILAIVFCIAALSYFIAHLMPKKKISPAFYPVLALSAICLAASFWAMQELESPDSIAKYEAQVNALFSDRAMEKYGVQFDGVITDENIDKASATLRGTPPTTVNLGFTKDGDLILLNDGLELPVK